MKMASQYPGGQPLTVAVCKGRVKQAHVFGDGLRRVGLLAWPADIHKLSHCQNWRQEVRRRQGANVHAGTDLLRQLQPGKRVLVSLTCLICIHTLQTSAH